ncbi:MAG: preprotein translocase subunit SecG [Candidatus Velthaea sp.]
MLPAFIAAVAAAATPAAKATTLTLTPEQLQQLQNTAAIPKSPLALHAGWLTHGFAGIFMISAVLLVLLLAAQTTKQEGLSGTIGGRVESAYKGRVGMDKQIQRLTTAVAVTFVLFATLVSLSGI